MTLNELQYLEKLLLRIKPQDEHVAKALAIVKKNQTIFWARKGQIKDQYDGDFRGL